MGPWGAEREPQICPEESGPAEPGQFGPALLMYAFSNEKRTCASYPQIYEPLSLHMLLSSLKIIAIQN